MSEVWRDVVGFFERYPYLEALAIVVGFALLARLADRLLTVTLRRLAARSETQFDDKLVDLIHRPISRSWRNSSSISVTTSSSASLMTRSPSYP